VESYKPNFLVLDGDRMKNFSLVLKIKMRMKQASLLK